MQKEGLCCRISFVDAEASVGGVAQLGEHHVRNVGVKGSNPSISTQNRSEVSGFFVLEMAWLRIFLDFRGVGWKPGKREK